MTDDIKENQLKIRSVKNSLKFIGEYLDIIQGKIPRDLTEEELELVEPEDVKKVTMVSNWKAYAKKRDAVLHEQVYRLLLLCLESQYLYLMCLYE